MRLGAVGIFTWWLQMAARAILSLLLLVCDLGRQDKVVLKAVRKWSIKQLKRQIFSQGLVENKTEL